MGWLIGVGVAVALLLGIWYWRSSRKYDALYHPLHLAELAYVTKRIKEEALANAGQALDVREWDPEHPPAGIAVTRAGLVIFYSVDPEDGIYGHHVSMSYQGGWFAMGAARFVTAYLHHLLGLGSVPVALGLSDGGRYHVTWQMDEDQQREYAARPVSLPTPETLGEIRARCFERGRELRFEKFALTLPE